MGMLWQDTNKSLTWPLNVFFLFSKSAVDRVQELDRFRQTFPIHTDMIYNLKLSNWTTIAYRLDWAALCFSATLQVLLPPYEEAIAIPPKEPPPQYMEAWEASSTDPKHPNTYLPNTSHYCWNTPKNKTHQRVRGWSQLGFVTLPTLD